jgi:hypothetical protein
MVKEPTTTKLGDAAFSRMPGVLTPEDVLSDPRGETVFLPPPERFFGLFEPRQLVHWLDFLRRDRVKMKQKSGSCKTTSDKVVNDIHRATRTRH